MPTMLRIRPAHAIPVLTMALAVAGIGLTTAPTLAAPTTVRYPSSECPDTGSKGLQECIDSVEGGSTIVLVDEVIDEDAYVNKSLTLKATDRSLRPILGGVSIGDGGAGSSVKVVVQDVRVTSGIYAPSITKGSDHEVTIRRVEVGKGSPSAYGIRFTAFVPMSLTVEDSYIRSTDDEVDALTFYTDRSGGKARFRAVGNTITQKGGVSGSGIAVSTFGAGTNDVDLISNSIFDVARDGKGGDSGIFLYVADDAKTDANVIGNTVARAAFVAFNLRNGLTQDGRIRLDLFDNTFSHSGSGIMLDAGVKGTLTLRAGFNNTYANKARDYYAGQPKGTGNLHKDPRFRDLRKGDLRLRSGSPLIDRGLVCTPGGQVATDAAGRHRLAGRSVDIGAFERGAGPASGKVLLGGGGADRLIGTSGADILCGHGGKDTLDGRGGRDFVDGGTGNDRVIGGTGVDRVLGNTGNDTLCTRDGVTGDRADGGPGTDKAHTDRGDTRVSLEGSARC